jgi:hypothetical protein
MTAAGRHSPNKCPHCGASPRYGLDAHVQRCGKRPVMVAIATPPVVAWSVPHDPQRFGEPTTAECPKCGKVFKTKHVPHFHARSCKGDA